MSPAAVAAGPGFLLVVVAPWAEVTVDGRPIGQTPLGRPLALAAGRHDVVLAHPRYDTFRKRVTIHSGETLKLSVDLDVEGIPRKR